MITKCHRGIIASMVGLDAGTPGNNLGILLPNSGGSYLTNWAGTTTVNNIDEGIADSDGQSISAATTSQNRNTTLGQSYGITDMPTDFKSMDSLSWRIRYRGASSSGDDTLAFKMVIVDPVDGTILAGAASGLESTDSNRTIIKTGVNTTWSTTFSTSSVNAFGYVDTSASKTKWNRSEVVLYSIHIQNMGPDDNFVIVDSLEFTGLYTN